VKYVIWLFLKVIELAELEDLVVLFVVDDEPVELAAVVVSSAAVMISIWKQPFYKKKN